MPTIPTGKLERELRRLYMQWVHQLPNHEHDLHKYVAKFQKQSMDLIEKMGGNVARLGALAGFPAPRRLDLSPHIGTIYSNMELAAISAQISLGLNPRQTAQELVRAGVDKSYRRLERLARTETVSAYWKNAWDSTEGLGLVMVWGAERGPRTCQWCLERDGLVMDSPDLRDHPNGRCTPLPTHPSQVDYRGSVRADGQIYQDPAWSKATPPMPSVASFPYDDLHPSLYEDSGWTLDEFRNNRVQRQRDWRFASNLDDRAAILMQGSYDSERVVKGIAKNISNGLDPWSGISLDEDWLNDWLKAPGNFRDLRSAYALTEAQIRAQLEQAAHTTLTWGSQAVGTQYKGLRLTGDWQSSFTPGSVHDLWQSSFTPDLRTAASYASGEYAEGVLPKAFDQVIIEVTDGRGHRIKSPLDRFADENLVTGKLRIDSVERGDNGVFQIKATQL